MLKDKYNHQESEKKWQKYWRQNDIFKWKNDLSREQTFVIDTPPPTVSGVLHMGHVFSYTQADFIARYQRMSGKDVFYPIGFDDNGLPTERLVEKIIGKKAGVFESENGHGSFTAKCREVVETAEKEFEILFNEIALSVDWSQKYQTISPQSQKISQASFVDLYHKKLVEKKFEPVFWDISDRTALAQADLVDKEVEGVMNYILFGIDGGDKKIEIMTTRPELLPACVAVMVHPNDSRYKHLHDKHAITPIFGVKVPIIADEDVLMDKGTGAVMCCTFGDEADIKWWKKYNLELKIIIGKNGLIEFPDFATIHHRKIKEAKDIIIEMLREKNLLKNQEKITRFVKCAERSGAPIEILVMPQWFVKILDKKEELKAKASQCNWYPNFMKVRIDQWIDGLSWDWCISRQRFFGVKFPVWFSKRKNEEGKILVANIDQLPCDPSIDLPKGYLREEVDAETDIMDTWATSSMSPQLSSQGISDEISFDEARHRKLFPADLRPQAHEIIRSWAFYTIVKAHLHENKIPWKNLMISGWCLAADKSKMSKSKGNVVTPTALIEEKGSDVVRYWASTSHLGADTAYSDDVFKIGQKLLTKLYNAAKFASMNFTPHPNPLPASGARESI
ncbi:MAG TPA: valine--tRNA ligase, partial [Rickettsiales bacterium]|nr:valine--tRNA ligase [Rickettsiales bacterium]